MNHTTNETSWTREPRDAKQFISRKAASEACESIGFPKRCAYSATIMGFKLWTIADDHCRMLTESGFKVLLANEISVGGLTHDPERDGLETDDCHE